jgi:hypothetical protein
VSFFRRLVDKLKNSFDRNRNVEFKAFHKLSFIPRGQPAKLSSQSKAELLSNDYVPIGLIEVKHRTSQEWEDGHQKVFPEKMDLKSDLLSEAAKRGGDVVTLTHNKEVIIKELVKTGRCLRYETRYITKQRPVYERNGLYGRTYQTGYESYTDEERYCAKWEIINGQEFSKFSEGVVWRKDPDLAGKTTLHEIHRLLETTR